MKIIWTKHAEHRQKEWEKTHGITRQQIEDIVTNPEQIVPGDMDVLIAHAKVGKGLLRVPFLHSGAFRKLLTVYWTSKIDKYWKEENHEDKV